jgi:hypothetical protein
MVVGQSQRQRQRLCSGVRMFTGNDLSSTPRALRVRGVELERTPLMIYVSTWYSGVRMFTGHSIMLCIMLYYSGISDLSFS